MTCTRPMLFIRVIHNFLRYVSGVGASHAAQNFLQALGLGGNWVLKVGW